MSLTALGNQSKHQGYIPWKYSQLSAESSNSLFGHQGLMIWYMAIRECVTDRLRYVRTDYLPSEICFSLRGYQKVFQTSFCWKHFQPTWASCRQDVCAILRSQRAQVDYINMVTHLLKLRTDLDNCNRYYDIQVTSRHLSFSWTSWVMAMANHSWAPPLPSQPTLDVIQSIEDIIRSTSA